MYVSIKRKTNKQSNTTYTQVLNMYNKEETRATILSCGYKLLRVIRHRRPLPPPSHPRQASLWWPGGYCESHRVYIYIYMYIHICPRSNNHDINNKKQRTPMFSTCIEIKENHQ